MKRLLVALAAMMLLMAMGCGSVKTVDRNTQIENDQGKDYASIAVKNLFIDGDKNGSLTINNQASFDIVIFAGKVNGGNIMGGIKAGGNRTFDLSKLNLPGKSGSFLIRAVAARTYDRNNLRVQESDVLYAGLVVYNLNDPKDKTNINIYPGITQEPKEFIYVSNTSNFVLELRLETPTGDKIATLGPLEEFKKIYLTPKADGIPYTFYSTYVYVDPSTNEINSFTTTDRKQRLRQIPQTIVQNPLKFEGPANSSQIAYNVAFLRISNQTGEGFMFMNSGLPLADQKGNRYQSSGQKLTYELEASSGDAGELYANLFFEMDNTIEKRMDAVRFRPGFVYDVVYTKLNGNYNYDIRETEQKSKLEEMRMNLFFGG